MVALADRPFASTVLEGAGTSSPPPRRTSPTRHGSGRGRGPSCSTGPPGSSSAGAAAAVPTRAASPATPRRNSRASRNISTTTGSSASWNRASSGSPRSSRCSARRHRPRSGRGGLEGLGIAAGLASLAAQGSGDFPLQGRQTSSSSRCCAGRRRACTGVISWTLSDRLGEASGKGDLVLNDWSCSWCSPLRRAVVTRRSGMRLSTRRQNASRKRAGATRHERVRSRDPTPEVALTPGAASAARSTQ